MPRSLNEPVAFMPSNFSSSLRPGVIAADSRGAGMSGVSPSNSVTTGVASDTGR